MLPVVNLSQRCDMFHTSSSVNDGTFSHDGQAYVTHAQTDSPGNSMDSTLPQIQHVHSGSSEVATKASLMITAALFSVIAYRFGIGTL